MRVNRIYDRVTVQGEGRFAGARCTFVRLYGCNLHCVWCDSAETWDTKALNGIEYPYRDNSTTLTPYEVALQVVRLDVDLCVITGGEPLLQRSDLIELARILHGHNIAIHIETNGTLAPGDALAQHIEYFTVSPKLPSAHAGDAINLPVLRSFARMGWKRAGFKTVVTTPAEIDETVTLYNDIGVHRRGRWVMPEGTDADTLNQRLTTLTEHALHHGMSVTGRQHITLWGNQRGR